MQKKKTPNLSYKDQVNTKAEIASFELSVILYN